MSVYLSVCLSVSSPFWSIGLSLHQWLFSQSKRLSYGENISGLKQQKFISHSCYRFSAGLQGAPIINVSGIVASGATFSLGIAIHEEWHRLEERIDWQFHVDNSINAPVQKLHP